MGHEPASRQKRLYSRAMAQSRSRRKTQRSAVVPTEPAPTGKKKRSKKPEGSLLTVRRIHRRDINKVWEFLKVSFKDVNAETVEYQRPRSKHRFEEIYEEEGIEQLLFDVDGQIVAYAECSYEVIGSDNWINPRYFE